MSDFNIAMSPLADPVMGAIFSNAEEAGLAAESLVRVTLEADGNSALMGRVTRVTPQRTYLDPQKRGCRVDSRAQVQCKTAYLLSRGLL